MNIPLVPMDRSHLSGVAALERLCFSAPWTEAMLEEELYNDTASFIVAQGENGEVLGYAGLHVVLDEGYIDNVAVLPEYRRQGVASVLTNRLARAVFERGIVPFYAFAWSNVRSVKNAIRSGFSPAWVAMTARAAE